MRRGTNSPFHSPAPQPPLHESPKKFQPRFLDDESLVNLSNEEIEPALRSARQATRSNNPELRIAMCTPTLLSWLCPLILSCNPSLQTDAIALVVNLSLEPPNRTRILKSGILNLLIGLLRNGANADARGLVVAALHSLSIEDKNRITIGALGVVPLLVEVFSRQDEESVARHDAGMAIYYLTFSPDNRGRVVKTNGAVRRIVGVVKRDQGEDIKSVAMRIACNLARCEDGRNALMEADGVAVMVGFIQNSIGRRTDRNHVPDQRQNRREEMEYIAAATIYGMSKGKSLRFRGMAKAANLEEVLSRVLEERNGAMGEMARRTLKAIRGEGDAAEDQRNEWYELIGSRGAGGAAISEPMRRRYPSYGGHSGGHSAVSDLDWMQ